jgi:hypothetical protein
MLVCLAGCASSMERIASSGDLDAARAAIQKGGDLSSTWGTSPIHKAVAKGDVDMVRLFRDNGAPLNVCYLDTDYPGYWTVSQSDYFSDYLPPIGSAIARNDLPMVRELTLMGAPLEQQCVKAFGNTYNFSAIMVAAEYGHKEIVEFFLIHGSSVNRLMDNYTPLSIAAYRGHYDVALTLLRNGAFHTYSNQIPQPVEVADKEGHQDIVDLLVSAGAVRPVRKDPYAGLKTLADNLVAGAIIVGAAYILVEGVKSGAVGDAVGGGGYSGCKVYVTSYQSSADYAVYLTNYQSSERNERIIEGCRLTQYASSADVTVYLTNYQSSADIVIHRSDFPSR